MRSDSKDRSFKSLASLAFLPVSPWVSVGRSTVPHICLPKYGTSSHYFGASLIVTTSHWVCPPRVFERAIVSTFPTPCLRTSGDLFQNVGEARKECCPTFGSRCPICHGRVLGQYVFSAPGTALAAAAKVSVVRYRIRACGRQEIFSKMSARLAKSADPLAAAAVRLAM